MDTLKQKLETITREQTQKRHKPKILMQMSHTKGFAFFVGIRWIRGRRQKKKSNKNGKRGYMGLLPLCKTERVVLCRMILWLYDQDSPCPFLLKEQSFLLILKWKQKRPNSKPNRTEITNTCHRHMSNRTITGWTYRFSCFNNVSGSVAGPNLNPIVIIFNQCLISESHSLYLSDQTSISTLQWRDFHRNLRYSDRSVEYGRELRRWRSASWRRRRERCGIGEQDVAGRA